MSNQHRLMYAGRLARIVTQHQKTHLRVVIKLDDGDKVAFGQTFSLKTDPRTLAHYRNYLQAELATTGGYDLTAYDENPPKGFVDQAACALLTLAKAESTKFLRHKLFDPTIDPDLPKPPKGDNHE